jgi:hypothetical protein
MADNQEVVEMSEKFLASLFGLFKKWVIDWAINSQKLFHILQQVRKEDLIGLVEGTHEIKLKAIASKTVSANEDFECIYTSELITIPDMGAITADCKKLWSEKMGSTPIPEGLKVGVQKRVKIIRLKKNKSSQEVVDHLKQYTGAVLPNVFGLRIAEMNCLSYLPKGMYVRAVDDRDNLSVFADNLRMVPYVILSLR